MADNYKREDLEQLICEVMGLKSITSSLNNQINRLCLQDDLSFKDIARTIIWYVEVAKKEVNPIYGISFVPNVFPQAAEYFRQLKLDQQRKEEEAKKIVKNQDNNIIFHIKSRPHVKRKPKHFNIEEINVQGEESDD